VRVAVDLMTGVAGDAQTAEEVRLGEGLEGDLGRKLVESGLVFRRKAIVINEILVRQIGAVAFQADHDVGDGKGGILGRPQDDGMSLWLEGEPVVEEREHRRTREMGASAAV